MKQYILLLVSLVTFSQVTNAKDLNIFETVQKEIKKNIHGALEVIHHFEHGIEKQIYLPHLHTHHDYERQAEFLQQKEKQIKVNQERLQSGRKLYTCDNKERVHGDSQDALHFFPIEVGRLDSRNHTISNVQGFCFQNITFQYSHVIQGDQIRQVTITVHTENPINMFCKDWFLVATHQFYHMETFFFRGKHVMTFNNLKENARAGIDMNGIRIYQFCDGYWDTFMSAFHTFENFFGGLTMHKDWPKPLSSEIPQYMIDGNLRFLKNTMGYEMVPREVDFYNIDESLIESGDVFVIMRLDGLDPLIMYGSGAHVGHCSMALRFDGELYFIESQDSWYWPKRNIQRNKYKQWVKNAKEAQYHVTHMRVSKEARQQFNETAAREFFFFTENLPYGYHNFLFAWLDTPSDNNPPVLPPGILSNVFSIFETVMPEVADIFMNQALNKRLGTHGLNMAEIANEAALRNLTVDDVIAMPEIEGWEYEGIKPRDGRSYVCSTYLTAVYKAAGLFGNMSFNPGEQTPKDLYLLKIYDDKPDQRNKECLKYDPGQPYCQLLGKYRMKFPGYNTIVPYPNMNERCPSIAPEYERTDGC